MEKNNPPTHNSCANTNHTYDPFSPSPFDISRPEQALWRAVITQALMDAASNSKKPETAYFRNEARHWLTGNSAAFYDVCLLAGLDPDYTRRMAKRALARNCKWRNEPGQGRKKKAKKHPKKNEEKAEEHASCQVIQLRHFLGAA